MMIRSAATWFRRRAGFRGMFLLLVALFDAFYGWGLTAGIPLAYHLVVPERAWGIIWLSVAAILVQGAFVISDRWHYALASLLGCAWALELFRITAGHGSLEWTRGAYFLVLALIVTLVSAWPEPSPPRTKL